MQAGFLVGVPFYADVHHRQPPPSLHMCATAHLTEADVAAVAAALKKAAQQLLQG